MMYYPLVISLLNKPFCFEWDQFFNLCLCIEFSYYQLMFYLCYVVPRIVVDEFVRRGFPSSSKKVPVSDPAVVVIAEGTWEDVVVPSSPPQPFDVENVMD